MCQSSSSLKLGGILVHIVTTTNKQRPTKILAEANKQTDKYIGNIIS
jgi:hypothetical protein